MFEKLLARAEHTPTRWSRHIFGRSGRWFSAIKNEFF
jgi:hypothetical protein